MKHDWRITKYDPKKRNSQGWKRRLTRIMFAQTCSVGR